jgi:hypothetical protein
MLFRAAILLATLLIPVGALAAAEPDRPAAPKTKAAVRSPPMIFYLAKGENGACGRLGPAAAHVPHPAWQTQAADILSLARRQRDGIIGDRPASARARHDRRRVGNGPGRLRGNN